MLHEEEGEWTLSFYWAACVHALAHVVGPVRRSCFTAVKIGYRIVV